MCRFFKAGPTRSERVAGGVTVNCRVRFARDPRGCVLFGYFFILGLTTMMIVIV